jgi:hypothetical protein
VSRYEMIIITSSLYHALAYLLVHQRRNEA